MSCRKILTKNRLADLNWSCRVFFGYFLCAKESNPRSSAEKIPGFAKNAAFTRVVGEAIFPPHRRLVVRLGWMPKSRPLAFDSGRQVIFRQSRLT
jgi:hypothetical protein